MPNRILRETILESEAVNRLGFAAEVFYRRLMSVVDDFGRFDARPGVLRCRLYPLKVDTVREAEIARWIAECVKAGVIALYAVNGAGGSRWVAECDPAGPTASADERVYLLLHKLGVPRAAKSKFPDPPAPVGGEPPPSADLCAQPRARARTPKQSPTDEGGCEHAPADVPYSDSGSDPNPKPPNPPPGGGVCLDGRPPDPGAGIEIIRTARYAEFVAKWVSLKLPGHDTLIASGVDQNHRRDRFERLQRESEVFRDRWPEALEWMSRHAGAMGKKPGFDGIFVDTFLKPGFIVKVFEKQWGAPPKEQAKVTDPAVLAASNAQMFAPHGEPLA